VIYVLTAANAVILGLVVYFFVTFRHALEASGVRQIDGYLQELEGSVAQLTEEFERTSTRISKDLLRKTTELQTLIGECDTKLAAVGRVPSAGVAPAAAPLSAPRPATRPPVAPLAGMPTVPPAVAARRMNAGRMALPGEGARQVATSSAATTTGMAPAVAATQSPNAGPSAEISEPVVSPRAPDATEATAVQSEPPAAAATPQPNDKYRLIFLLASEGMDSGSIARHTNLTRGEVEMLLDLRKQGKI